VNNRFDNEPIRLPVANRCRRSRFAYEAVFPLALITVLTVARTSMLSLRECTQESEGDRCAHRISGRAGTRATCEQRDPAH